jgi:putative DNA primase/helicase
METFVATNNERHSTELAGLQGARLVTASETEAGKRWDEAKLKLMTGGDPIRARYMRQDFFTYTPQFKLIFIGNHKPEIRNLDKAMRRRTHLVPFTVTPKVVDKELGRKLRAEWPAILAWMIEGCLDWQRIGLAPPPVVLEATEEYFTESDPAGQWLAENSEPDTESYVELTDLFANWREWANRRGDYVGRIQRLAAVLTAKGYVKRQNSRNRRIEFGGLRLVNRQDPVEDLLK